MVIVYQEPRRSRQKGMPPHFNPLSCCAFLPIIPEMFHMNMLGNNVMLGHLPFLLKKRTQVYSPTLRERLCSFWNGRIVFYYTDASSFFQSVFYWFTIRLFCRIVAITNNSTRSILVHLKFLEMELLEVPGRRYCPIALPKVCPLLSPAMEIFFLEPWSSSQLCPAPS